MQAKHLGNQNSNIVMTHADKTKTTIVLDSKGYLSKAMNKLNHRTTNQSNFEETTRDRGIMYMIRNVELLKKKSILV